MKGVEEHINSLSLTFSTLSQMLEQSKSDTLKSISFCKSYLNNSIKDFEKNKSVYSSNGNAGLRSIHDILCYFERSIVKGEERNSNNEKSIKSLEEQVLELRRSK